MINRVLRTALSIALSTSAWADFTATPEEARGIAKRAYLYGFPVVEMAARATMADIS